MLYHFQTEAMNLVDLDQEDMECDVQDDSAVESDDGEFGDNCRRIVFTGGATPESNILRSCSRQIKTPEAKYLSMARRVGFISKSRLSSQSGDIRLNWKKKLNKPRLGMVADLEEEACGKKTSVLTIVENPTSEEIFPRSNFREHEPLIRVVTQDISSISEDDEEKPRRTFHFISENEFESFNNIPLEEDCGQGLEMDNSNIIIKISQDNVDPEALNNNTEVFEEEEEDEDNDVPREQEDGGEMTVLDKIAAIKEIDRKLLTIERERTRALRKGYKLKKAVPDSRDKAKREGRNVKSRYSKTQNNHNICGDPCSRCLCRRGL